MPVRLIALNANSGALIAISASIPCRFVTMVEDEAAPAQGLVYQSLTDNFATTNTVSPGSEPVILGNAESRGGGVGPVLGYPSNLNATLGPQTTDPSFRGATVLFKAKSATATITTVRITEYE